MVRQNRCRKTSKGDSANITKSGGREEKGAFNQKREVIEQRLDVSPDQGLPEPRFQVMEEALSDK